MKYCYRAFLLLVLVFLLSSSPASSGNNRADQCLSCHDKAYNKAMMSSYIHKPFQEKKCFTCHVDGEDLPSDSSQQERSKRQKRSTITWLQKHYEPARTHFFLLPSNKIYQKLFIQIKGQDNKSRVTSIPLPPISELSSLNNDETHPEISNIQFHGIKRGVLYSAIISWETDRPANSQVLYGIGKFNQKSNLDVQLKKRHTISISPIRPGKTYSYTVTSTDIHGNKSISQPQTFSADTPAIPLPETDISMQEGTRADKLSYKLLAVDEFYFVTITASSPTYMSIGKDDTLRPRITIQSPGKENTPPTTHIALRNSRETNITVCLTCHAGYQTESSHPIDVGPRRGMTFPDDYPLFDDGKMHCMTCHDAHTSKNEARIRRPTKQELCVGCHKSYG